MKHNYRERFREWFGPDSDQEGLIYLEEIMNQLLKHPSWNLEKVLDEIDLDDETLNSLMRDLEGQIPDSGI